MKTRYIAPAFAVLFSVAAATAHTGATGVVLERMQGMTALADAMKAVAPIVRGQVDHDAAVVAAAGAEIARHASPETVALFEEGTDAAPSQASPAIWEDPEAFAALFDDLRRAGMALSDGAASPERTTQAFADIAQTCVACHEDFRIKRDE